MSLYALLQQRAASGKPIRVGLIGAGKFGSMYLAQIPRTPGVHLAGIADLSPQGARANLARVGWKPERTQVSSLDSALKEGTTHVGDDWRALVRHPAIDVIVECTGHPIAAVDHCLEAFATASMSSTSPSRPMPSAARCSRTRPGRRVWCIRSRSATSRR